MDFLDHTDQFKEQVIPLDLCLYTWQVNGTGSESGDNEEATTTKAVQKNLISDNNGNIITTRSRSGSTRNYKDDDLKNTNQTPRKSNKKKVNESPSKTKATKPELEKPTCNGDGDEGISSDEEVKSENVSSDNHGIDTTRSLEKDAVNLIIKVDPEEKSLDQSEIVDNNIDPARASTSSKDNFSDTGGNAETSKMVKDVDTEVKDVDPKSLQISQNVALRKILSGNIVAMETDISVRDHADSLKISNNLDHSKHSIDQDRDGFIIAGMLNDDERESNSDSGILLSPSPLLSDRTCEHCGAVKKSPADLQRHLRKHTGERPFICQICNRAFKAKRSLQNHQHAQHYIALQRNTEYISHLPDRGLGMKYKLENDYSLENGNLTKRFRSEDSLVDQDSVSSNTSSPGDNGSLRESPESGIEMMENGKDRVCQICGKVCLKPSDLRRHMMCHTGEKPFKCDICGKPFRAKNSMHYHMKASHGVNIELSPGLQERYLRLKKQSRLNTVMSKIAGMEQDSGNTLGPEIPQENKSDFTSFASSASSYHYNTPPSFSTAGFSRETTSLEDMQKEMNANACSISNFTDGKAVLDPETGLFKHHGYYIDPSNIPESDIDGSIQIVKPGKSLVGTEIVQESPFCKSRISVKNETVLVTRIDGVNLVTGNETSLYKCYLCGKVFNHLTQIQCHLSMHFEKDIVVYECQICRDPFWFKFQVIQHIRKKHPHRMRHPSLIEHSCIPVDKDGEKNSQDVPRGNQLSSENLNTSKENIPVDDSKDSENSAADENSDLAEVFAENDIKKGKSLNEEMQDTSDTVDGENSLRQFYRGLKYRKNSNGSYICVICRKSFFREQSLLKHIHIHSGNSLYYCEDCGQGFNVYLTLRQHIIQAHGITDGIGPGKKEDSDRSLLSSLLQKTSHNWSSVSSVLSHEMKIEKENIEKEKAKALLESEGIEEDFTVVLPCDPEDIKKEPEEKESNQKSWSESDSELDNEDREGKDVVESKLANSSEIMTSPRRTMLSKLSKAINKRKSKMPMQIKQEVIDVNADNSSKEPIVEKKENIPETSVPNFVPSVSVPTIPAMPPFMMNGSMTMPPITSQGLMNPALNPVLLANSLAASSSAQQFLQGASSSSIQQFLQGAAAAAAAAAASSSAQQLLQGAAYLPALAASLQMNPMMGMPISVNVPTTEADPVPSIKKEPSPESPMQSSDSNPDSGNKSSTAESSSADPSPNKSSDREQLVGCPRVQWSPSSEASNSSNLGLHWAPMNHISADGRKVTSLSRTHSRLPIVNTPVNREKVCKPTTLPDGRTVYRCPFCSKDFLSYSDINRHMDFHEDIRPYKCNFCEYYARTNSQLKVHMMRHKGIREFCCKLCNYKGVTQSDLNRHMKSQIHLLKARNSCKHCGEGFVTAKNLERHTNGNCIVKVQEENGLGI